MKLVPIRMLAGAIGLVAVTAALPATATAGPLTPDPLTVQTIGVDYPGFSCPGPVAAVPDVNTTLVLTTETNFNAVTFVVPSLNIRVPLPFTLSTVFQYVNMGRLHRGAIPYEIDAPPMTGSYGWSCRGVFEVGIAPNTA